jgi:hypothetical protein
MRRSWIVGAVGAGALLMGGAVVLAADTGSGRSPRVSLERLVAGAAERTGRLPGERMGMSGTVQTQGETIAMRGDGIFDRTSGLGRMRIVVSGGGAPETLREISVGSSPGAATLYLQLPDLAASLPPGKAWIRMNVEAMGRRLGVDVSALDSLQQSPGVSLQTLRAIGDVHEVGVEHLSGERLTRYAGTLDLAHLPDVVPPSRRDAARRLVAFLQQSTGGRTLAEEVWIDRHGIVRRVRQRMHLHTTDDNGDTIAGVEDITVALSEFRGHPELALPPADQVVDAASVLG